MLPLIYIQLIGLVAVCISLVVFQANNRGTMLKLGMVASVLYAIHYLLLGAPTGAAMNLIGGSRSLFLYKLAPGKKRLSVFLLFASLAVVATILTWHGPVSLLAMAGSIGSSFAFWHTKPKHIRRWIVIVPPLWFVYAAIVGSYPGMLIEVILLLSILVGDYRLDWRQKRHNRTGMARPA